MTTQLLEEKPSTQTTSEAEPTQISEPAKEQLSEESVQQNSEQDTTSQEPESTDRPDPRLARVEALKEAEREELRQQVREETVAELTGQTSAQQREQERQKVRSAHTNTLAKIDSIVAGAVDEYGSPRSLTQAEAGQIKAAQNEYHKVAMDAAYDIVADDIRDTAYSMLPKAAQEQLTTLTNDGADLPTYLNHWAETAALHTKAVKSMTLEDATKASPKIKREVEKAKLDSFDEGREQGRLDPPGTSPDAGRTGSRSAPAMKTYIELETKYGNGTATKAESAEYERLRDQRAKSR